MRYVIHSGLNQAIVPGYPYCYFVILYKYGLVDAHGVAVTNIKPKGNI